MLTEKQICPGPRVMRGNLAKDLGQGAPGRANGICKVFGLFYICLFVLRERKRERELPGTRGRSRGGAERIPSRIHTGNAEHDSGLEPKNREIMT